MKVFYLTIITALFFYLDVNAQQRSTFALESGGYYITRDKNDGNGEKRFFGIGLRVHGWPNTASTCPRMPLENEFTSAKQIFNVLMAREYPDYWGQCEAQFGIGTAIPDFFHLRDSDALILTGHGRTEWELTTKPSSYIFHEDGIVDGALGPIDQSILSSVLSTTYVNNIVTSITNFVDHNSMPTDSSDFVYFMLDEPDRGSGKSWYFHSNAISKLKNSSVLPSATLGYLDLGPVSGNHFLWSGTQPENDLNAYGEDLLEKSSNEEYTLKNTVAYYKNSTDILGINSYSETSCNPFKLGQFVSWIHEEADDIAVWPWVSAERWRYNSCDYDTNIRAQAYSAIINRAAGVLFYNERKAKNPSNASATDAEWDEVLDIAKELHYYKYFIEKAESITSGFSTSGYYKYISFKIANTYLTLINSLIISASDAYYGYTTGSISNLLGYPKNLGFEKPLSTSGYLGNWQVTETVYPNVYSEINSDPNYKKIGSQSIYLYDDSNIYRTAVSQEFDIVPGFEYQVQAWHKRISGAQRILMLFYNESGYISEHGVTNNWTTEGKWAYYKSTPVTAPPNATKIILHIGSFHNNWNNITSEGYWDDVMVKIVGDGSSSSKVNPLSESYSNPYSFSLEQNYPNPFNPTTTISYSIKEQEFVTLKVFNLAGQQVATLVNSDRNPGSYEVIFDASFLSSGIYFYELRSGNQVLREKMTLIK